jgi:competence protein ComEC
MWLGSGTAGRVADWIGACFAADRGRLPLLVPVLVGLGIAAYFAWPTEPSALLPATGFAAALILGWVRRRDGRALGTAALIALVALGFGAAVLRAHLVATPVLAKRLPGAEVIGRVAVVEVRPGNVLRLTLEELDVEGLEAATTPRRVRVTLRGARELVPGLAAGVRVRLRATLMPPPAPAAPGAYDFARDLWFQGIGATGFAFGAVELLDGGAAGGGWAAWLMRLRLHLAERVAAPLPPTEGAIAAALIVGVRGEVPREVEQAWRDSGLAHILSISGLHVGLAAGFVFVAVRGLLALVERLALTQPIKKWAAAAALASAIVYLFLSGADTPVQRSVLMAGLALVGVMLDRPAISLRLVAWAALVILLILPESLTNASFQMSFAAVTALVAGFDALAGPIRRWRGERPGIGRRLAVYLAGVALSTLLASLATLPFGLFHFNRAVNYGLLANLVGVPITGVVIMPAALVALVAMPLGLEVWPLRVMGAGISAVDWIAHAVAALPGAVTATGAIPTLALALTVCGGLWLVIWRSSWRMLGLAPVAMAIVLGLHARPPNLLVDGEGRIFLIRGGGDAWLSGNSRSLDAETWLRRAGLDSADRLPQAGATANGRLACDALGCAWRPYGDHGPLVIVARRPDGLAEDCREAMVLVSLEPIRRTCRGPRLVIDRFDLWRHGAHAVWLRDDGELAVANVADDRGDRPWSQRSESSKIRTRYASKFTFDGSRARRIEDGRSSSHDKNISPDVENFPQ